MNAPFQFRLSGVARSVAAQRLLDEVCEHFNGHGEVERDAGGAMLVSPFGTAQLRLSDDVLTLDLACASNDILEMSRTSLVEHMFHFAGADPLEISWSVPVERRVLPNLHEVTVVSVENITPHMRRVTFACANVAPFTKGDMHVRILVPPKGRAPVWPEYGADGRIMWPRGEDELLVRVYTIRKVDAARGELIVDFLQHPTEGVATPGADFARDAQPGDRAALLGPGGGGVPRAQSLLLIGDESALPAIARIAEEVPAQTQVRAIIEVENAQEEQMLVSAAKIDVHWLHRKDFPPKARSVLVDEAKRAISVAPADSFVWVACERDDVRQIRAFLKDEGRERSKIYAAWYWERSGG